MLPPPDRLRRAGQVGRLSRLLATAVLLTAGCQSRDAGNSAAAAVATTSAVVVGGALSPVGSVVRAVRGQTRHLAEPSLFELAPGRIVVTNEVGWFTDRSEIVPRGNTRSFSAWVLDLSTADQGGRLLLTPANLERWFWRHHPYDRLARLPRHDPATATGSANGYEWDAAQREVTLHYAGRTHRIALVQGHVAGE